jgi:type VI protein secretion system component VasK
MAETDEIIVRSDRLARILSCLALIAAVVALILVLGTMRRTNKLEETKVSQPAKSSQEIVPQSGNAGNVPGATTQNSGGR